jgi:hypothetical protein
MKFGLGSSCHCKTQSVLQFGQGNQVSQFRTGYPHFDELFAISCDYSDAGNGVGYTGIRVRGSDATRVNVTINGIPYNDSESHGTYWVNMPDFAS